VDEAILGVYLAGSNSRRIRGALAPLLRGGPLSKDAVSRLVGRLAEDFRSWQTRDLAADQIRYLFLDGWYPKVRLGKRRVRVPVLVTMGVRADGQRVVIDLRLVGDKSTAAWRDVIQQLGARHLGTPALAVIDGNPGLATALREAGPTLPLQRCTAHTLRNLTAKAPVRLREEVAEDFRRVIYAETEVLVRQRRTTFLKKWRLQCPAVAQSFEGGRRRAVHLPPLPDVAVEGAEDDERVGADQRRVPASAKDAGEPAEPGRRAVAAVRFAACRSHQGPED
jgi:transposase-like protein